ncbi:MAG: hypothetical protein H6739_23375 [Alphaproteobacteria bacterium]|nr:hypothetical protein [Alphaproteobacteria bacterium]
MRRLLWLLLLAPLPALAQDDPSGDEEVPDDERELGDFEAPVEPEPEPEYEPALRPAVAAHLGGAIHPLTPLGVGALIRLEASTELPFWGGRLRPVATVGWTAPRYEGTGTDERLPEPFGYTLVQRQLLVNVGLSVRAFDGGAFLSPELWVAPQLYWLQTVVDSSVSGTDLGRTEERAIRVGWLAAPGVSVRAPRGQVLVHLGGSGARFDGVLNGEASGLSLNVTVGYRMHLGGPR